MKKFKTLCLLFALNTILHAENENFLPSGNFENDPNGDGVAAGWYINNHNGNLKASMSKDCVQGNFSQQIMAKNAEGYLIGGFDSRTCFIPVEPGKKCILNFHSKKSAPGKANATIHWMRNNNFNEPPIGGNGIKIDSESWKKYEIVEVPPEKAKYALIQFWVAGKDKEGSLWIDDLHLEIPEKKTVQNQAKKAETVKHPKQKGYSVRPQKGAPAIFHNDKALPASIYFNCTWNGQESVSEEAREMLKAGVHIHHLSAGLDWGDRFASGDIEKEGSAYLSLDSRIKAIMKIDPNAKFLLNVHTFVPRHWEEAYPSEITAGKEGALIREGNLRACNSFASKLWQKEVGKRIIALIKYMKRQEYYDAVIGLHSFVGWEGQWTWWYPNSKLYATKDEYRKVAGLSADYSPAMTEYFREWVRKKYKNDLSYLRKEWDDTEITFEKIVVPSNKIICESDFFLFKNPSKGKTKYVRDYFEAYKDCRLDTLFYWGKIIKEETKDNPKLYGSYYGSILHSAVGGTKNILRHICGYQEICDSPYIDYFISAPNYPTRQIGGDGLNNLLNNSLSLHNKFVIYEQDQPTHLSIKRKDKAETGQSSVPKNLEESIAIIKRNFSYTLCKSRMGYWWWDQEASKNKNNPVRYNAPEIWKLFKKSSKIESDSLNNDCSSISEIAVFYSEKTNYFFSLNEWLPGRNIIVKQVMQFAKIGAPYDLYEIGDISKIRPYKLYIFWNAFYLSDNEIKMIDNKVKQNASTVLWIYAPGYAGNSGLSLDRISKLTGINMAILDKRMSLATKIDNKSNPITKEICGTRDGILTKYGSVKISDEKIGPVLYCDDPNASSLGTFIANGKTSLALKEFPEWKSVYAGFFPVSSKLLREIAKYAGAHIYNNNDDVVYANKSYLCIHSDKPGKRTINLPTQANVYDLFDEDCKAEATTNFVIDLKGPDTKLFKIEPVEKKK